jgi:hypothetical protein
MAYVLNLADVLVAPSEYHRERMLDFPIDPERIVALPHGLDHAPYARIQRRPRPVKKIGFIGSVIPIKGAHVLVDAFRHLARPDLELHVHGDAFAFHDDKNYFERLKSRAIGLRNVFFHGAYLPEDLPEILSELDVLVVPSLWWESFCLTIREGQLAGLPVIASDLGAMREALDGEGCGLLFRPGDADELAERILRVIEDDDLRARLSDCRHAVKSIEQYVPEILGIYERAQRESARRAGTIVVAPPWFPPPPPEVRVSWTLPDESPIVLGPADPDSEKHLRVAISDKATGARLGMLDLGVESPLPLVLRAKDGARRAAAPRPAAPTAPAPAATPPPRFAAAAREERPVATDAPGGPVPPVAAPGAAPRVRARRSRRHRRERRHRPT